MMNGSLRRFGAPVVIFAALFTTTGCYVKKKDFDMRLAAMRDSIRSEVRTEVQQGDATVSQNLNNVNTTLGGRITTLEQRVNGLATELSALRNEFQVTVERFGNQIKFSAPVFFGFDEAELREGDLQVLDRFTEVIRANYPEVTITAEGFTDPAGSTAYNQKLGMARASSVTNYLATKGLQPSKLRAVSYGEQTERQLDPGAFGADRGMANRRVVLVIDGIAAPATE
jgi:peptidoglycan-associated lipoprotein